MASAVDSLLDISLNQEPLIGEDLDVEDLKAALRNIIDALTTLHGEVERIRIATGTVAPP